MLSEWVAKAIEFAGTSQAEVARHLSDVLRREIDRAAVNKMTRGTRNVSADELLEISRLTRFPVPETGAERQCPLVGLVGADAEASYYGEGQGPLDYVAGPEGATDKTVAVEVRGDSLGAMLDGWIIFYDDRRDGSPEDFLGRMCVLGLEDGRVVVKTLARGQLPKRYNLIANVGPPIYDAKVSWAALVKEMRPK